MIKTSTPNTKSNHFKGDTRHQEIFQPPSAEGVVASKLFLACVCNLRIYSVSQYEQLSLVVVFFNIGVASLSNNHQIFFKPTFQEYGDLLLPKSHLHELITGIAKFSSSISAIQALLTERPSFFRWKIGKIRESIRVDFLEVEKQTAGLKVGVVAWHRAMSCYVPIHRMLLSLRFAFNYLAIISESKYHIETKWFKLWVGSLASEAICLLSDKFL